MSYTRYPSDIAISTNIATIRAVFGDRADEDPSNTRVGIVARVDRFRRQGTVVILELVDATGSKLHCYVQREVSLTCHLEANRVRPGVTVSVKGQIVKLDDLVLLVDELQVG